MRDGSIVISEARVAETERDAPETAARYAAIRLALLEAGFGGKEAWRSTVDDARSRAEELASAAGLAEPPTLDDTELTVVELKGHS
jgi:hypothetical protein